MSLKLKSVTLRNWMTVVKEQTVEFPEHGLIFVDGVNQSTPNGQIESVGSGKSSLGEALCLALFGKKLRFTETGHYSHKEKGNMLVLVDAEVGGKPFKVELTYKCKDRNKTGEALRYFWNGEWTSRPNLVSTRSDISNIIQLKPEIALWTVIVDGDHLKVDDLNQAAAVELLMQSLNQPSWSFYHDEAKRVLANVKETVSKSEAEVDTLQRVVDSTTISITSAEEAVDKQKTLVEALKLEMDAKIKRLEADVECTSGKIESNIAQEKQLAAKIKELEQQKAEELHKFEIELMAAQGALAIARSETQKFKDKKTQELNVVKQSLVEAKAKLNTAKNQTQAFNDGAVATAKVKLQSLKTRKTDLENAKLDCPTCQRPWKEKPVDKINQLAELITEAASALNATLLEADALKRVENEVSAAVDTINAQISSIASESVDDRLVVAERECSKAVDDINASITALTNKGEIRELSDKIHTLEIERGRFNNTKTQTLNEVAKLKLGPSTSALDSAKAVLQERRQLLATTTANLDQAKVDLAESRQLQQVVAYWTCAFSPSGIPNLVLAASIEPMNHIAESFSRRMTDGIISIRFSTDRQLASGQIKNELNIAVDNAVGSSRARGSSKGESGLVNLIVSEALAEVGRVESRIKFKWCDEVINSQDGSVRKHVLAYLREKARSLGMLIFVSSHHPEIASFADSTLTATKNKDGHTSYSWR